MFRKRGSQLLFIESKIMGDMRIDSVRSSQTRGISSEQPRLFNKQATSVVHNHGGYRIRDIGYMIWANPQCDEPARAKLGIEVPGQNQIEPGLPAALGAGELRNRRGVE